MRVDLYTPRYDRKLLIAAFFRYAKARTLEDVRNIVASNAEAFIETVVQEYLEELEAQ